MKIIYEQNRDLAVSLYEHSYIARLEEIEEEKGIAIPRDGIGDAAREWWAISVDQGLLPMTEADCSEAGRVTAIEIIPTLLEDLEERDRMARDERAAEILNRHS